MVRATVYGHLPEYTGLCVNGGEVGGGRGGGGRKTGGVRAEMWQTDKQKDNRMRSDRRER